VRAAGIEDDGSAGTGVHRDHEAVGNRMIPALVPVPHHHALRHQPDKLTERRSPDGGPDNQWAARSMPLRHFLTSPLCIACGLSASEIVEERGGVSETTDMADSLSFGPVVTFKTRPRLRGNGKFGSSSMWRVALALGRPG
jgi:hypothetical protein